MAHWRWANWLDTDRHIPSMKRLFRVLQSVRFTSVKLQVRVLSCPYMAPWCRNRGVFRLSGDCLQCHIECREESDRKDRRFLLFRTPTPPRENWPNPETRYGNQSPNCPSTDEFPDHRMTAYKLAVNVSDLMIKTSLCGKIHSKNRAVRESSTRRSATQI